MIILLDYISETEHIIDPWARWDFIKLRIKKGSLKYSNKKAKARKAERKSVEDKIQILEQQLSVGSDPNILTQHKVAKNMSEKLYNHITEGIIFRSKFNWY